MKSKNLLFVFLMAIFALYGTHANAVIYIVPNGTGNGSSWENGAPIDSLKSKVDTEAWIKEGTYNIESGFYLGQGARLYGGFKGNETSFDQRDIHIRPVFTSNCTMFSIGGNSTSRTVHFDNLEFANCDLLSAGNRMLLEVYGSLQINNCIFRDNAATESVGIVAFDNSNITISNCLFTRNKVSSKFGILRNQGTVTFCNTTIVGNVGEGAFDWNRVGGIFVERGNVRFYNTILWGNTPGNIRCDASSGATAEFYNTAISNTENDNGRNTWGYDYIVTESQKEGSKIVLDESCIKLSLDNNVDTEDAKAPKFVDPENGNYHLSAESPLIAAGDDPAGLLTDNTYDLDGNLCLDENFNIDLGAYQYSEIGTGITAINTGNTELKCYPNPVNNILYIDAEGAHQANVYSITGTLVYSSNILASGQLDLQSLTPGFYQIVVKTKNGTLTTSIVKR
ncbi:T9SS type A sorting domain-containing protein [Barnesiella intestinihominis]|uniref:T9SS type A sorting domain-containing protein n=1 Tax=Barnesiella intestinihominis TaxID=487174 RepID=UPI00267747ED|nr:T9SS type A sorting domain-containing protein [Barnesiella intestinihominis]